ncbi:hypothetical protein NIES39_A00450 [Arthrospira platensis NIES-39]|nr:hypothetical protein NIES39_A00450 [Arthrospira platensis NIES-39]
MLSILAKIIIPTERDEALALMGEYGFDVNQIRNTLTNPRYNDRNVGRRMSEVKAIIDAYVLDHRFCFLNPNRSMEHLKARLAAAPDIFPPSKIRGASIIDFGSGRFDMLGISILLFANMARHIYAVETARPDRKLPYLAALETAKLILSKLEKYKLLPIDSEEMKRRVATIDYEKIEIISADGVPDNGIHINEGITVQKSIDGIQQNSIDLIMSTSVLEHVRDFEQVMRQQFSLLKPGGVAIHAVDFTDHRHDLPEYHPFMFYYDNKKKDVNGMRDVDMIRIFDNIGFSVKTTRVFKLDEKDIDVERLTAHYKRYPVKDLLTRGATFVLLRE